MHLSPRPLFAALSPEAQLRAFAPAPSHARKAILATNIAETSVTVSGVRYVIDAGLVKSRGYSARMGAESLLVVPVSRAQAVQRSGRAGREAPGVAFRLYTEETFVRELAEVRVCGCVGGVDARHVCEGAGGGEGVGVGGGRFV